MALDGCNKKKDIDDNLQDHNYKSNYFPDNIFSERDDHNSFINESYSKQLKALDEPSIYAQKHDPSRQLYRFTWLRSFHNSVSIRLEIEKDGSGLLYVKMSNALEENSAEKITKNEIIIIEKEDVHEFLELLAQKNFWKLPSAREIFGLDGAEWIIEGLSNGKYHLVDRWSPEKEDSIRKIGLFLLHLSNLDIKEIY